MLPHDVYQILEAEPELIKKYSEIVMQSQIQSDNNAHLCLCCNSLITPAHSEISNVGRCAKCKFATCIRCNEGYHGPLSCARMKDFFDERLVRKRKKTQRIM